MLSKIIRIEMEINSTRRVTSHDLNVKGACDLHN